MPKLRIYTWHSLDRNLRKSGFVGHLFSISLLPSKDGKPTFTLRIQQRITTSSPICVLMNTTGLTPNKGQQLSKWQDHIVDPLRCPCSKRKRQFKSIQQCWNAFEIPPNGSELIWKLQPFWNKFGLASLRPVPKDRVPKPRMVPALLHKERRHGSHGSFVRVMCPWMWHFLYFPQ